MPRVVGNGPHPRAVKPVGCLNFKNQKYAGKKKRMRKKGGGKEMPINSTYKRAG